MAPITFDAEPATRRLSLQVPGLGSFQTTPQQPGAPPHGLGVPLGGGFEYLVAELGSAVRLSSRLRAREERRHDTFAHFASVQWSNAI